MSDPILLFYAAAVGFFAAGVVAAFHRMVTSEPARFGSSAPAPFGWMVALVVGAIGGPAIIVRHSVASARTGRIPTSAAAAGVIIAGVWSCVVGIALLEVSSAVRDSLV